MALSEVNVEEEEKKIVVEEEEEDEMKWVCDSSLDYKGRLPLLPVLGKLRFSLLVSIFTSIYIYILC